MILVFPLVHGPPPPLPAPLLLPAEPQVGDHRAGAVGCRAGAVVAAGVWARVSRAECVRAGAVGGVVGVLWCQLLDFGGYYCGCWAEGVRGRVWITEGGVVF